MGKIMVTGALGNVGGYVAKYLIQNGQDVVVADISMEALEQRYGEGAKCVLLDFTDRRTFAAALDGVDRVFIMRPPHLGKPEDLKPFIDALKEKGGIRLVSFLSLIGVEHNPFPPHHKIEKYIERAGTMVTAIIINTITTTIISIATTLAFITTTSTIIIVTNNTTIITTIITTITVNTITTTLITTTVTILIFTTTADPSLLLQHIFIPLQNLLQQTHSKIRHCFCPARILAVVSRRLLKIPAAASRRLLKIPGTVQILH